MYWWGVWQYANVHISIDQEMNLFHRLLVLYRTLQVIFLMFI